MREDNEFAEYAAARWRALVHAGMGLGCSLADVEDLAQDTLVVVHRTWAQVRAAQHPDAYVSTILLNRFRSSRRRRWWGERPTEHVPDRVRADDTSEVPVRDAVARALSVLTPRHREVLVLRYFLDLTEAETAHVLGIPLGTVKSRHARALATLAGNGHLQDLDAQEERA